MNIRSSNSSHRIIDVSYHVTTATTFICLSCAVLYAKKLPYLKHCHLGGVAPIPQHCHLGGVVPIPQHCHLGGNQLL